MYRTIRLFLFSLLVTSTAFAYFPIGPDHTLNQPTYNLLTNKFLAIKNLGSYLVGVTEDGFMFFTIDDSDSVIVPVSKEYVDFKPVSVKHVNDQLIFTSDSGVLYFYDISKLPEVTYQGKIALGVSFADYVINGRYIYVSRWFDGIWRYRISSFSNVAFVDSSMKGILVTQLARSDTYLYALDEYNGIMRYVFQGSNFGSFVDYLFIPERPHGFILSDSETFVQTTQPGVYRGRFRQEFGESNAVYDSTDVTATNEQLLRYDDILALANQRGVTLLKLQSPMHELRHFQLDDVRPDGDLVNLQHKPYLLLPGETNGAMFVPLSEYGEPFSALSRPGIILGIQTHGNALITAGAANPLDVYRFDADEAPEFLYTIPNTATNIRATDMKGDSLVVLYAPDNRIDLILHPTDSSAVQVLSYPFAQSNRAIGLQLYSRLRDSIPAIVVQEADRLQMIPLQVGDSLAPTSQIWETATQINRFFITDSTLLIATTKHTLLLYVIDSQFKTKYRAVLNLSDDAEDFYQLDPQHLLLFVDRVILKCDISIPTAPKIDASVVLPIAITHVDVDNNVLFSVGPNGVGIFSMKSEMPVLLDRGGKWGNLISVLGNTVTTTDGTEIHIYHLRDYSNDSLPAPPPEPILPKTFTLKQNYPNPFNGKTKIAYDIPATSHVVLSVYNILGQRVITLVDQTQTGGSYEVVWDGKTEDGKDVSTGIYYYEIDSEQTHVTKKMLLLK